VHPEILSAYMSGDLIKIFNKKSSARLKRRYARLNVNEIRVLALLKERSMSAK
jgi:DNA topoisomerase-1